MGLRVEKKKKKKLISSASFIKVSEFIFIPFVDLMSWEISYGNFICRLDSAICQM